MITAIARTEMEESIQACCKSLFLTSAIPEFIKEDGTPKQIEYLAAALRKEVVRRDENKRERLVKRARFPVYKTFDGYEYRCVKLPPALSKEDLEAVRFIEHKGNGCTCRTIRETDLLASICIQMGWETVSEERLGEIERVMVSDDGVEIVRMAKAS